jgi:hypothetical protein
MLYALCFILSHLNSESVRKHVNFCVTKGPQNGKTLVNTQNNLYLLIIFRGKDGFCFSVQFLSQLSTCRFYNLAPLV